MRLATFNVRHGSDGPGARPDVAALAAAVHGLGADVVGLQEVDRERRRSSMVDQVAAVAAHSGAASAFGRALSPPDGEYGNALLARGSIRDAEVRLLPRVTAPWQRPAESRSALLATVGVDGREVTVLVTHLSTQWYEAMVQLRGAAAMVADRSRPRVLMGDLNLGTLLSRLALLGSGLSLVVGGGPTHPRSRPRMRIDHIATSGLRVTDVSVVDAGVSDHRALVVEAADDPQAT